MTDQHNGPHLILFKIRVTRLILKQSMCLEDKANEPKGLFMFLAESREEAEKMFWESIPVARPSDFTIESNQVPYNKMFVQIGHNMYNEYLGESHYSNRKQGARQHVKARPKTEPTIKMPSLQNGRASDVQPSDNSQSNFNPVKRRVHPWKESNCH